jgi:hypothetical protein
MAAAYIDAPDLTAPAEDRVCDRMRFLETNSPDGYYILMDWLEIPNLRSKSLAYLGSLMCRRVAGKSQLQFAFAIFGIASFGYGILAGIAVLIIYHVKFKALVAVFLPPSGAEIIGWTLASTMTLLILHRLIAGLKLKVRRAKTSRRVGSFTQRCVTRHER